MKLQALILNGFLLLALMIVACQPEDKPGEEVVEDVSYAEQLVADDALIREYLQTHTYNYEDFYEDSSASVEIIIDTLAGESANKTPLIDLVRSTQVPVIDGEQTIEHTLYQLVVKQGTREENKPTIVDSVYLAYKGKLLNGYIFDQNSFPVWFDLAGVIKGFQYGLQEFAPGNYAVNTDGTISFEDFGQGLLFLPSGLGYFSQIKVDIPAYSPLIFDVSVYTTNVTDHDNDGILSINEDPDGDGNPYNDDTDQNGIYNMFDPDDDGDGVLTVNEYDVDEDGQPDDDDNDGIPNYLDPDNN